MSPHDTEHMFIAEDGAKIAYRAWWPAGVARRGLILLHRGHEHAGRLAGVARALDLAQTVVFAWDARGHGQTGGADAVSVTALVRDLDQLVRVIGEEHGLGPERLAVMGQSLGAVVAAAWVHDHAPPIRALVLVTPAFGIRLWVPLARPALRLLRRVAPGARVRSAVRPAMLSRDPAEQARYAADPLITRDIGLGLLLDVADTSRRLIGDADAIRVPTLVQTAGADWVVRDGPQRAFFERLGGHPKQFVRYAGARHGLLHDHAREAAIAQARHFLLEAFDRSAPSPPAAEENLGVYHALSRPLPLRSPRRLFFAGARLVLGTLGRLSEGITIGRRHGFDSGPSLDHVYRNTPAGRGPIGRWLDRRYLEQAGWRAIRARKANLERAVGAAIEALEAEGRPVRLLDVACGGGRYVLDVLATLPAGRATAELRDRDPAALEAARALARVRGIDGVLVRQASAFDPVAFLTTWPRPTVAIVSGLWELFPDNPVVQRSLRLLHATLADGGYLIYTNQPWHPQLELIARVLVTAEGRPWRMRCRPQAEMDALAREAGFAKRRQWVDDAGIASVTLAQKAVPA